MKIIFVVMLSLFFVQDLAAQVNDKRIGGVVRNLQNEPFAGATVRLLRATDSLWIAEKIAGTKGNFDFDKMVNGVYVLNISAVGVQVYRSQPFTIDDDHVDIVLPPIFLLPSAAVELKTVTVTAKRPLLVQDIDKTIVNVDAMISSATSNTLEVLSKTPGVTVSNNGDIGLNGKNGVLVLIDGRSTYMSGTDLSNYLKSLPGILLDKIELMDNPPAKYDASGSAIINIRLKKNRVSGLTGNIAAGYSQGVYARHNEGINVNFNRKKINLFGNLGYSKENNYAEDVYDRKFYGDDKQLMSAVLLRNFQKSTFDGISVRLGMDYAASAKTTYGFVVNMSTNPGTRVLDYRSNSFNTNNQLDSVGMGEVSGNNKRHSLSTNLNYLHKFNDKGREISGDLNYIHYSFPGFQHLSDFSYDANETLLNSRAFYYDLFSAIHIYNAKADYVHPLKGNASWEAGIKSSIVSNEDDSKYFDVHGGELVPDYSKSNRFLYRENINAAYVNTRKSWTRLGAQLGLRLENTRLSGNQLGNMLAEGSSFSRHYTGLFPTAFLSYKLDSSGKNTLTISWARRIRRPNYQQLNPFLAFRDNYSYTTGNPMINPQYHYRTELRYQHKKFLNMGLQYGRFTDVIFDVTETSGNIFITRPGNVASGFMLIGTVNVSLNPTVWWSVNTNLMLARMGLDGMAATEKLNPAANSVRLNVINQFNFKKGWSAEMSGNYTSKDIQGQSIIKPRYQVYAAAQKKILNDKATIRIAIEDMFHSWVQKDNSVSLKQASAYHRYESDTQRIGIAFTYRFGKESFSRKRNHSDNAAGSETGRVD